MKLTGKWHMIMRVNAQSQTASAELVCLWPHKDDGNGGLPDWFFEKASVITLDMEWFYDHFECNFVDDIVEWIPTIGPAPCWEAKLSDYETFEALYADFYNWLGETY